MPQFKTSEPAIRRLIDTYLNILVYLDTADEVESAYVLSVVNSREISATDKQTEITGRVGQASFRNKLERLWRGRCAITGATHLLNASHIKPWAHSSDHERLDPFNGLLLSPVYDRAFDQGLVTFEDSGAIRISPELLASVKQLSISTTASIRGLNELSYQYLDYHRSHIYRK